MKKQLIVLLSLAILASCSSESNTNDLAGKKAKLTTLKSELATLNGKILALENEIAALDTTQKAEKTKLVSIETLTPIVFNHFIDVQGSVTADQEIIVTPKLPGTVTRILVKVGDKVRQGQLLAELDDALMRQNLSALQTQLDFTTTLFNKQKSLWDQNIGTEVQYLSAKTQKEALEKQISTLQEQWEMYRVKAPISGTIDDISMKIGQPSAPGNVYGAIRLVNLSNLKVKAELAEAYAGKVREGNEVLLNMPDINRQIKARIHYVGKVINPSNRTFTVEVLIPGGSAGLIPNMVTLLQIVDYSRPNTMVIPLNNIQKGMEGDYVMVVAEENGKKTARKVLVTIGNIYQDKAEITSGLKAGDRLIITGFQDLNDGDLLVFE